MLPAGKFYIGKNRSERAYNIADNMKLLFMTVEMKSDEGVEICSEMQRWKHPRWRARQTQGVDDQKHDTSKEMKASMCDRNGRKVERKCREVRT